MKKYIGIICLAVLVSVSGCQKTFEVLQDDVLVRDRAYQDINDADAAVMGAYGKLALIAEQYIVLNEVRGDLLDVTANAPQDAEDLSRHQVSAKNTFIKPQSFYEIIINCNDVIHNLGVMESQNRIESAEAAQRIADLTMLRAWVYLQLGIHFGEVPYFTDPVADVKDLENPALYQRIGFEALLDNLIASCESFSNDLKTGYPVTASINFILDGYPTTKMFIKRWSVLGELHLWKGNYLQAAQYFKLIMNTGNTVGGRSGSTANLVDDVDFDLYRLSNQTTNINYSRGIYNWKNIFQNPFGERYADEEIIWNLPFDNRFAPTSPFAKWFSVSNTLAQPSALLLDDWSRQTNIDNEPGDRRGLNNSYRLSGEQMHVSKFELGGMANVINPNAKLILLRASAVHLKFAEAANRLDRNRLAYALVNSGILASFTGQRTNDVAPFDFDARETSGYRKTWYRNAGVRGRSGMAAIALDSARYFDMTVLPRTLINKQLLVSDIEDMILDEAGRENAFEGYRWPDLLRIALRREKEAAGSGIQFLNTILSNKYTLSGKSGFVPKTSIEQFYLPFVWEK